MAKKAPKKATEEAPKVTPAKKVEEKPKVVKKNVVVPQKKAMITNTKVRPKEVVPEKIGPSKTKRFGEDKYDKISEKAGAEAFKEMGQKVQNGTHQWAYYAVENESGVGYHYYLKKS